MKQVVAVLGLALASVVPGAAFAAPDELVVVGVTDGQLAAKSLIAGNYESAVHRLAAPRPDGANDPARLINLGNAYMGMGRIADAHEAYKSARFAPDSVVVLASGEEASSRDVARRALGRLEAGYAMR